MRSFATFALLLLFACSTTLAQQPAQPSAGAANAKLALTSSAFSQGGEIPRQYTCKGADTSLPLEWSGGPAQVASFALILEDPDAPGGTWVHWVVWGLPPTSHAIPEGLPKREQLDDGSRQGRNDFHKTGYNGPCPPGGATHRYFIRLYALDFKPDLPGTANHANLESAMQGHILAQAEYMGTFHK